MGDYRYIQDNKHNFVIITGRASMATIRPMPQGGSTTKINDYAYAKKGEDPGKMDDYTYAKGGQHLGYGSTCNVFRVFMADNELFRVLGGLRDLLFQAYIRIGVHPWCYIGHLLSSWKPI